MCVITCPFMGKQAGHMLLCVVWVYVCGVWVCTTGETEEQYRHQLGSFGVSGELAMRPVVSLLGGQKSRVAFALMAMTR